MRLLLPLAALLALPSLAALAQSAPVPPVAASNPAGIVNVTVTTSWGPIVIAVDKEHAPITAANFLKYVDQKRLDGVNFYRAVKIQPGYGFIQFGTGNDPKRTLPPIPHEPTSKTGLSHKDGAISMAMGKPGTASGDFFIIVGDLSTMDATATDPGYAVFGQVVTGMDIVHRIMDAPTSPTRGEGLMKGQMLEPAIKVQTVRRSPALPAAQVPTPTPSVG
ncbi:peptidylprolyl isomerase [Sphingomonas sp. CL5.1]|uniref:peptidylprolyl isomerase n=1 Tax=Sphingomonas sp. CL5.1 TaxID=2653203 RepID=UPI0015842D62|nr:peptidylprolyl isomerase [Sphingomonas sp. CL5.1]QKS01041.1 peptidylprolyl isomerase [Sphingomonas sp. CL5.1]